MRRRTKGYTISLVIILGLVGISFFPARIRQGIDGNVRTIEMPLSIKVMEFISRDCQYRRLAKEITSNYQSDKEKVLAIFDWVVQNIHSDYPRSWYIIDDHIFNIIIRRYGTSDQLADVFATLCTYAGIPAFWNKIYSEEYDRSTILTFVRLDGAWRVFDVSYGIYFKNKDGDIAEMGEIIKEEGIVTNKGESLTECKVDYADCLSSLQPVKMKTALRAKRQMPVDRVLYEIGRLIKGERYLVLEK